MLPPETHVWLETWKTDQLPAKDHALRQASEWLRTEVANLASALEALVDLDPEFGNAVFGNCSDLEVPGDLSIINFKSLTQFPDGFKVHGSLEVRVCASFESLPRGLSVNYLYLSVCGSFKSLPEGLVIKPLQRGGGRRRLTIDCCPNWDQVIPSDARIMGEIAIGEEACGWKWPMSVEEWRWKQKILTDVRPLYSTWKTGVTNAAGEALNQVMQDETLSWAISEGRLLSIAVRAFLDLDPAFGNAAFYDAFDGSFNTVQGSVDLDHCNALTRLPGKLAVNGDLSLVYCQNLVSMSKILVVHGNLNLSGCSALCELPKALIVFDTLNLSGCQSFTTLPEMLSLGSEQRRPPTLDLSGCTGWDRKLPSNRGNQFSNLPSKFIDPVGKIRNSFFSKRGKIKYIINHPTFKSIAVDICICAIVGLLYLLLIKEPKMVGYIFIIIAYLVGTALRLLFRHLYGLATSIRNNWSILKKIQKQAN